MEKKIMKYCFTATLEATYWSSRSSNSLGFQMNNFRRGTSITTKYRQWMKIKFLLCLNHYTFRSLMQQVAHPEYYNYYLTHFTHEENESSQSTSPRSRLLVNMRAETWSLSDSKIWAIDPYAFALLSCQKFHISTV